MNKLSLSLRLALDDFGASDDDEGTPWPYGRVAHGGQSQSDGAVSPSAPWTTICDSDQTLEIPLACEGFNPPLPNAVSLPWGTWYCDMKSVHWAQGENGTGKCPLCGMDLVLKV
jgi:hypothetical protein